MRPGNTNPKLTQSELPRKRPLAPADDGIIKLYLRVTWTGLEEERDRERESDDMITVPACCP